MWDPLRLCKYPITCHSVPTNLGIPWWILAEAAITVAFAKWWFSISIVPSVVPGIRLFIQLCTYISCGHEHLFHSVDYNPLLSLFSCSNCPRFVHSECCKLAFVPFQGATILGGGRELFYFLLSYRSQLTMYFCCPRWDGTISARIPVSFYWRALFRYQDLTARGIHFSSLVLHWNNGHSCSLSQTPVFCHMCVLVPGRGNDGWAQTTAP